MNRGFLLLLFMALIFKTSEAQKVALHGRFPRIEKFSTEKYYQLILKNNTPKSVRLQVKMHAIRQIEESVFIVDDYQLNTIRILQGWFTIKVPVNNNWKLSETLFKLKTNGNDYKQFIFYIHVKNLAAVDIKLLKEQKVGKVSIGDMSILTMHSTAQEIKHLFLNDDNVVYIDVMIKKPKAELGVPGFDLSANKINLVQSEFPQINGNGLQVSIKEDFFDTTDIDIKDRILPSPLASTNVSNHANFMSTIVAGAGNSVYYAKGVATNALISSSSFEPVLPDADNYYQQQNILVQNHSYGSEIDNHYGLNAVAFDKSANDNPNLLHVFSSGNAGTSASTSGTYANVTGYANLTGNYKMAKNTILVGAVDSFGNAAPLSSAGPAYDGRIKPEITAFQKNGTSESAALVSGSCLLLQQYYQSLYQVPMSSALAKAILINSADDLNTTGPDYKTGFGNLNAYKAMQTVKHNRIFTGEMRTANSQSFILTVPANASLVKVTLCWNDTVAAVDAGTALINDLDLQVTTNTNTWLPWALSSFPSSDSLMLPAVRRRDSINNVEQVTINHPLAGEYNITVIPHHLTTEHQNYFLAYSIDTTNYFQWERITKTDFAEAGKQNLLRWNTTYKGVGNIEYSLTDNNWRTISNNVTLEDKNIYFNAPDTLSKAQLRMNIDGQYFYSDTFFISTLTQPTTGFICGDSLMVYWKKIKGARAYQLYQMGEKYLMPFKYTTDTAIVFDKQVLTQPYIAVAPIINDAAAVKSYAFDYTKQGAGCYINSFYVINTGNTASLNLSIGTLFNVRAIEFEKQANNSYNTISNVALTTAKDYTVNYTPLSSGINVFRAKIILANGRAVYSNPEAVFYAAPGEYLFFPTPVKRGNAITVISAAPDGEQILINDATGRLLLQKRITAVQDYIQTSALEAGIYFYRVIKNNQQLASGKLILQ